MSTDQTSFFSFPDTTRTLRVLTYNVWFDPKDYATRAALLLNIIRETNPDVVALQEVTGRFLQILKNDPMVVNEGTAGEEESGTAPLVREVCVKQLSHRQCPSPSPKRQIWTWDFDAVKNDGSTRAVARSILQSESGLVASKNRCEAKYTLISEPDMGDLKKYGTALLTRTSPKAMIHQVYVSGDMDRSIMAVELRLEPLPAPIWVATTHLESAEGPGGLDNHFVRKDQLADAFTALDTTASACPVLFMGDMNPTRPCEAEWVGAPWRDAWLTLRPDDPGFTKCCLTNPYTCSQQSRCDKVLFRDALPGAFHDRSSSSSPDVFLSPSDIQIVGQPCNPQAEAPPDFDPMCTPEPPARPEIVPSDHFGLCCEFSVTMRRAASY